MVWIDRVAEFFGVDSRLALAAFCILFSMVFSCVCCLFLAYAVCSAKKRARERRERRAAVKRRLQFTLPDKENGYLRDRLHTALCAQESDERNEEIDVADKKSVGVKLGYARKMLAKVKESALSPIERLDVEEMSRLVALYGRKGKWSGSDVKAINEIFARLLKLSAKYEIAV